MPRAFSDDLRCRILRAYAEGEESLRELAERFSVSWDYAKKIRKQQLRFGQMERVPQAHRGPKRWMTAAVESVLRAQLQAQPDLTLGELQQRLREQTGVSWSQSLVWLCLQRLELGRKKNAARL
jgi:transposase